MQLTPNSWGSTPLLEGQKELAKKYGIERFEPGKSIGYAPRTKEWYGWSHRAIAGFKVGSVVKKGDVIATKAPNPYGFKGAFEPGFTARTDADAMAMAAAFAEEVS